LSVRYVREFFVIKEASVGSFDGVGKRYSYFSKNDCSGCGLLEGVYLEEAAIISKHRCGVSE
jgi:hypothetical protein